MIKRQCQVLCMADSHHKISEQSRQNLWWRGKHSDSFRVTVKFFKHFKHILVLCSSHWCHNERDGVSNHRRLIVYLIVCSGADQRKHQSSASMVFLWRSHWWPVNSQHKGPVTPKKFPFDDVTIVCHHFPELAMPVLTLCTGHYLMKLCIQAIGFLSESINPWPRCKLAHIEYLSLTFNRTVYAYLGEPFITSYIWLVCPFCIYFRA